MKYSKLILCLLLALSTLTACKDDDVEARAIDFAKREAKAMITCNETDLATVCDEIEAWKLTLSSANQAKADSIEAAYLQQTFENNLIGE